MIIRLKKEVLQPEVEKIKQLLDDNSISYSYTELYKLPSLMVYQPLSNDLSAQLRSFSAVEYISPIDKEYMLGSRDYKSKYTTFDIQGACVGSNDINIIAGPCSVETEEQIFEVASFLKSVGVRFIRGGAFKPRTSPYRFQGLGMEGLKMIRRAADEYGLRVVTEVIDSSLIDDIYPYADILQVGSRNMQNFYFLKQLGKVDKPVLLKRGMYAKMDEWLMAAEYILNEGNERVILCERGIRTFDTSVRNTMDIAAIPLMKNLSHLPVFADPSHGTGRRDLISPVSLASIAAGADGLLIEIHPNPEKALSDGMQSLYLDQFKELLIAASPVAEAVGRRLDIYNTPVESKNLDLCVE